MRVARIVGYFLIALVVLVMLAVVFIDENRFKRYIERQLTDSLGRKVTIAGDLDIDPGWIFRVKLQRLRLANAAWSDRSEMLQAATL
jgi:uncharacterized protein involved in outer membrane biogenesis